MDPLYANYDKRKNSQENSTPTPTPSASMPVFGMPMNSTPSPFAPGPIVSGSTPAAPAPVSSAPAATSAPAPFAPTPVSSSEPATPIRPVAPSNFEPAKPIVSADPVSTQPNPFASQQQIPFSGKGDIVLNMNQPKQSKKGLFIALAGLAVAAVVALVVMVVMPKNGAENKISTDDEFNYFVEFAGDYSELYYLYSSNISAFSSDANNSMAFPISSAAIAQIKTVLGEVERTFSILNNSEILLSNPEIKSQIASTISKITINMELISNYYDAFIAPLWGLYDGNVEVLTCEETDAISALLADVTSEVAEEYFAFYCSFISMYNSGNFDESKIVPQIKQATGLLAEHIAKVDNQEMVIQKIQTMIEGEISNENEK